MNQETPTEDHTRSSRSDLFWVVVRLFGITIGIFSLLSLARTFVLFAPVIDAILQAYDSLIQQLVSGIILPAIRYFANPSNTQEVLDILMSKRLWDLIGSVCLALFSSWLYDKFFRKP